MPSLRLARLPTPVQRVRGLGVDLWLKRDDRARDPALEARLGIPWLPGGNKVRKLELVLAALQDAGARQLVTSGAWGSNHLLACAAYGRAAGLEPLCVVSSPTPEVERTRAEAIRRGFPANLLRSARRFGQLLSLTGGSEVRTTRPGLTPLVALGLVAALGDRRLVEPGASGPLGVLGYVAAACELAEQVRSGELPRPDRVVVAAGSGGTLAGLLLGLDLAGLSDVVVEGVRVVPWPLLTKTLVRAQRAGARRLLARRSGRRDLPAGLPVRLLGDQLGAGYAHATPAGLDALRALHDQAGVLLDPTYTGKALASVLQRARSGNLRSQRVLFWVTYDPGPSTT